MKPGDPGAKWAEQLGPIPSCLGSYVIGDSQCDGVPCRWRAGCSVWTARCEHLGVDPEKEKALLGGDTSLLVPQIRALLHLVPRQYADHRLHRLAWQRFLDSFAGRLPVDRVLAPTFDLASIGDLFVTWRSKGREGGKAGISPIPMYWIVALRVGATKGSSLPLLRFWPRPWKVVEPSVQLRIDTSLLLSRWPEAEHCCRRMRADAHLTRRRGPDASMRTILIRVFPDRIEDVGALAGELVRDRAYTDMRGAWRL